MRRRGIGDNEHADSSVTDAMVEVARAMNDYPRIHEHYAQALDEIYRLRCLIAHEAGVIDAHLTLKSFPKSRRRFAEAQVARMRRAAEGDSWHVYREVYDQSVGFRRAVGQTTLTRAEWESRDLATDGDTDAA